MSLENSKKTTNLTSPRRKSESISFDRLNEVLEFDTSVKHFRWKVSTGSRAVIGDIAGNLNPIGYWKIMIDRKQYLEHRLVWFFHHKTWSIKELDHINGIRHDNRIENLREATRQQNNFNRGSGKNNKSTGHKNIQPNGSGYRVSCGLNYKNVYLGTFRTIEEAITIRDQWITNHHGEFQFKKEPA